MLLQCTAPVAHLRAMRFSDRYSKAAGETSFGANGTARVDALDGAEQKFPQRQWVGSR